MLKLLFFTSRYLKEAPVQIENGFYTLRCIGLWNIIYKEDKSLFVTKIFAMKGIKIELLGITIIPLGIAVTTNNFWGYVLGVLGFGVAVVGCFLKDNH